MNTKKVSVVSGAVALVASIVNMISYRGRDNVMMAGSGMCIFGLVMALIGDVLYSDDHE